MTIAACAVLLLLASAAVVFGVQRINDLASRQEYVGDKLFGVRQVYETLQGMESSQRAFCSPAMRPILFPICAAASSWMASSRRSNSFSATIAIPARRSPRSSP
jgi:hypothetical protein